ncbi:N-acetylglucosamine kinase [Streptantibioticus rubrisoli]|uniref:ATPase n=1 Tax=Streptantibioticus rubrisoli TaxID=1387313 RepID=A0ABT1PJ81_9ACTN|nr:BadF/BadG/BcrA/BcrD ATPase family protein [Streptantibioticus rubrisoli]MCQ4045424.1 ATPase [Streptantibioticus rubrisoli]
MGLTTSEPLVTGGVLAIDAGNSKTDVAIVAADGSVLGTARGGGFHPHRIGAAKAVAGLAPLIALAAHEAGLAPDGRPLAELVSACLANADFPVEERRLELALHGYGWGRRTRVANDTFAILRTGVAEPRGVAVVCGAGINCVGMLPDGRTVRFPAVGRISGDWGGGVELAEEALWWAARAADGRGEPTALAAALPAHFGLGSMYALIEALHMAEIAAIRKHEMVPLLFRVAAEGDAVAVRIVRRQADEVVALASVALDRLGLLAEEVAVVLGGGVLAARHPLLMDGIADRLAAAAPRAVPHLVNAPPVLGAALLGLDRLAAPEEARARLRRHYAADVPQPKATQSAEK